MKKIQRTGVIRDYDMHAPGVRIGYGLILATCILMVVLAVFPLIWVTLAGFKDLKEFMSSTSILPRSFGFEPFVTTWSQLGISKNYLNSLISVTGSVVCALIFNGLLGYGIGILRPRGHGAVKRLVMLSLLMPPTISIVPLFMNIQKLHLGNSFIPLWLSYGAGSHSPISKWSASTGSTIYTSAVSSYMARYMSSTSFAWVNVSSIWVSSRWLEPSSVSTDENSSR